MDGPRDGVQVGLPGGARRVGEVLGRHQQGGQLVGPRLVVLLVEEDQLPQHVRVAQGVGAAGVAQVRGVGVVHRGAGEGRQDAQRVGRPAPPLGVHPVVRQRRGAGHVQPLPAAGHVHARLVEAGDGGPLERPRDRRLRRGEGRAAGRLRRLQRALGRRGAEEVLQQLLRARVGQQLVGVQVDAYRLEPVAVLHRLRHPRREPPRRLGAAGRARDPHHPVLDHRQPRRRQLEHLPPLAVQPLPRPLGARPAPQAAHCAGRWSARRSGVSTRRSVVPGCPGWPPGARPVVPGAGRRLRGAGFGRPRSLDGGLLLLWLSSASRSSSAATRPSSAVRRRTKPSTSATTASGPAR